MDLKKRKLIFRFDTSYFKWNSIYITFYNNKYKGVVKQHGFQIFHDKYMIHYMNNYKRQNQHILNNFLKDHGFLQK